jgi:uncharacterized membrane protein
MIEILQNLKKNWVELFFRGGVIVKGIDGLIESIAGGLLFFVPLNLLNHWLLILTQPELLEDPNDLIANWLTKIATDLSFGAKVFVAIYLIIHGLIKITLVISLLRHKRWAYPLALIFLLIFIGYQAYLLALRFSYPLFGLTIIDIIIVSLIYFDYKKLKNKDD